GYRQKLMAASIKNRAGRVLSMRRMVFVLTLRIGTFVSLPTLTVGLLWDDYDHHNRCTVYGGGLRDAFGTYDNFSPPESAEEMAQLPWYFHPEIQISFFRPLAGVTRYLDYQVFGERLLFHHMHSIAWYVVWLAAVWGVIGRL